MVLTIERLHERLAQRPLRFYEQVNSTQDVALQWLQQGAPAGAVVIADEQLKGRGRQGRIWHTPPGVALALSVILKPSRDQLSQITMLGALAIAETLDGLDAPDVTIKWPNDVRLRGRKVSGVLPEAVWNGEQLSGVALGMGINVRNDFTGTELETAATSIELALEQPVDRMEVLMALLQRIDYWAAVPATNERFVAWKSRLDTIGQRVTINSLTGTAEAVDKEGALLLRDDAGNLHRILAGDVALIN